MGTGYRGVKDIAFEFREVQWSSPRGLVAFKPAPNPALNKPLEANSNQKRLLKILLMLAHTHTHTQHTGSHTTHAHTRTVTVTHRTKDVGEF